MHISRLDWSTIYGIFGNPLSGETMHNKPQNIDQDAETLAISHTNSEDNFVKLKLNHVVITENNLDIFAIGVICKKI